jgi:hypothetical protein
MQENEELSAKLAAKQRDLVAASTDTAAVAGADVASLVQATAGQQEQQLAELASQLSNAQVRSGQGGTLGAAAAAIALWRGHASDCPEMRCKAPGSHAGAKELELRSSACGCGARPACRAGADGAAGRSCGGGRGRQGHRRAGSAGATWAAPNLESIRAAPLPRGKPATPTPLRLPSFPVPHTMKSPHSVTRPLSDSGGERQASRRAGEPRQLTAPCGGGAAARGRAGASRQRRLCKRHR